MQQVLTLMVIVVNVCSFPERDLNLPDGLSRLRPASSSCLELPEEEMRAFQPIAAQEEVSPLNSIKTKEESNSEITGSSRDGTCILLSICFVG